MTTTLAPERAAATPVRGRRRAVVVGGGLGGLATALRLRHLDYEVTVLERNARCGGRCDTWSEGGFTFDTGPTILLMRDVLERLFADCGRHLDDHLDLVRLQPNYRITFAGGAQLTITSDVQRLRDGLEAIERGAGDAYLRFLADAAYKYRISRERFVERNFLHMGQFLSPGNLPRLLDTGALRKLGNHVARYFKDPRLQIAFTFQSMYLGLAPRDAPAVYALLPYTELAEGIWYPRGGMYRIVVALLEVLERDGVEVRTGAEVTRIEHRDGRATGVALAAGGHLDADIVVCNADLPWAYEHLLDESVRAPYGSGRLERLRYGSSTLMLYLGMRGVSPDLLHHNVYIPADPTRHFDAIFRRAEVPDDPALYVHVPTRSDPTLAPEGHDCVYVLVPCAGTDAGPRWREGDGARLREHALDSLAHLGIPDARSRIVTERMVTPDDWRDLYNLRRGSTFGIAHDLFQVGVFRPANRHRKLRNLYFVGAATQPGGGVPMVFLGARLVAERVAAEAGHGG
ncbi:MAG TPA: phytoene desaturase family protein [Candidatus Dormibacteraeota bacterium]|nr:phytoene desaturase family protein [Candidatus Dormibacteraeota bacterium]